MAGSVNIDEKPVAKLVEKLKEFANEIYNELGSGHAEKVYEQALLVCLRDDAIKYEHQKVVEVTFRGHYVGEGYADVLIQCSDKNRLVVEVKALGAGKLGPPERTQVRKYMNMLRAQNGLLINFPQPDKLKKSKNREVEFEEIHLNLEMQP